MSHSQKICIGIVYGGKSAEHDVSLRSAKNVLDALDTKRFMPICIGIAKDGTWYLDTHQAMLEGAAKGIIRIAPVLGGNGLLTGIDRPEIDEKVDVIFPVLHGPMGEDGTVQGILELAGIPYVGPGVLGSAIGMDKDVMKRLLRDADIAVTDFITITETHIHPEAIIQRFGLPLFVKPANMGSSVGVTKVDAQKALLPAIRDALHFDTKILVEKAVAGDEIECAVLGNTNPQASIVGRIIPRKGDFYSYEAKYLDENGAVLEIPANIPPNSAEEARRIALKVFTALSCQGMARVDMFLRPDGRIIVNEINTIPGFTNISMYPKLWEATGVAYGELISQLIDLALERFQQRKRLSIDRKVR